MILCKIFIKNFRTMRLTILLTPLLTLIHFSSPQPSDNNPVAVIGNCHITGRKVTHADKEVNQFLGIPYAQRPEGQLRFKPTKPLDIDNYPDFPATAMKPACLQRPKYPFPWADTNSVQNENCLFLNVWAPADAGPVNTKAVMYWMYGGGYRLGSIGKELYDGTVLAAMGDIVVVTVNYRLGGLGFFTSGTEDAPGNAGFWDVLEGLRWVNRNIHAFGGDNSRVTIAGESAGSIFVGLLSASPLTTGLFQRQIMMSGSPTFLGFDNNQHNMPVGQNLAELLDCANGSYTLQDHPLQVTECLRGVDAETFIEKDAMINPRSSSNFLPQYGDEIMPTNPRIAVLNGNLTCSPLLIGTTEDEGAHRITIADPDLFGFFGSKDAKINKSTGKDILRRTFNLPESIINHYLPDDLPEDDFDDVRRQVHTALGDTSLLCPTVYHAETCSNEGSPVYYYHWKHHPSNSPWAYWMGATHFSEIEFVFGRPLLYPELYQDVREPGFSTEMVRIWTDFVKTGNPDPHHPWPLYSKNRPMARVLGLERRKYLLGPHANGCNFLRPTFYKGTKLSEF